jgi:hypothetical protein
MGQSMDALYEPAEEADDGGDDFPDNLPRTAPHKNFTLRPKLTEALFHAPSKNWSCNSITSDYDRDSNKDLYDSAGSWSSGSRGSSTNSNVSHALI